MRQQPVSSRRRFLAGVLAGLGAAGLARRVRAEERRPPERGETLFRRTRHVEAYYRTLED
ncbi:hypothetical protein [Deferrisoma camini]|uniref:hypothetical protein n=1 Tax=Deferrisoma camini TaxID=1035120 RepID=UPI00046CCFD3|nr:hypothetical protein [Deferrisoma camini]